MANDVEVQSQLKGWAKPIPVAADNTQQAVRRYRVNPSVMEHQFAEFLQKLHAVFGEEPLISDDKITVGGYTFLTGVEPVR